MSQSNLMLVERWFQFNVIQSVHSLKLPATWFEVDKSSLPLLVWTSRTMQNGARQFMFKQTYLMVSTYWKHLTT